MHFVVAIDAAAAAQGVEEPIALAALASARLIGLRHKSH
jgi:hypothetical protein